MLATAGIAFAMAHVIGVNHYVGTPLKRVLWVALAVGWVGLLAYVRVVKPWMMLRRPYAAARSTPNATTWSDPDGRIPMRRRYATMLALLSGALFVVVCAVFALIPH